MNTHPSTPPGMTTLVAYAGGVARGNPGLAGAGIILEGPDGTVLVRAAKYLGSGTGLEAQLQTISLALRYARPHAPRRLEVLLNNETAVRQLSSTSPRHPTVVAALGSLAELSAWCDDVSYRLGSNAEMADAVALAHTGIDTRLGPLPALDVPVP